ncbi:MAG: hypothetical protein JNL88_00075, partial [Bacteroidia bacterium]|nr:hypothetical protein [Bacteroidia bacterium]
MALQKGDVYAGDVSFNTSSGYIQVAFADTSTFGGDVTTNNSKVGFSSGSGLLQFNGAAHQTLNTAASLSAQKFLLDKSAGVLHSNRPISIDSVLTLNGGILRSDSLITLKAPVIVNGGSNFSHIDGPVKKIGNTAFVFPVGDQGQWNPVEITAPGQETDAFTARFYLQEQPHGTSMDTSIRCLNTCSYWNLTRTSGSSQVYVSLYWDSIACGLYDTTGLIVAAWDGATWKNTGKEGISGHVLAGNIKNSILTNYYNAFTWGDELEPGEPRVIPVTPVLNTGSSDPSWNHAISEDYFGYNGSSVLDPGQYWSDLAANAVLQRKGISNIRHNGGTNGNYWDWRTGWFIPENELPDDWYYLKKSHKKQLPQMVSGGTFVNEMQYFKVCSDAVAGRPVFQFNNLTSSGFNYELARLYRAHELNLPVRYVELGNEFYLNDEHYKEVYPSSFAYINYANSYSNALKSILPFENVKVAVVGTSAGESSPGRRSLWLETILSKIQNVPNRPDAITIHEYYSSGLNEPVSTVFGNANIGKMFIKPFEKGDELIANELQAIGIRSTELAISPALEVWLTEYNMNDDASNNVGTWAHGLFNAIQTLKYLESPLITHLCSHAMTSDAVYGNIFESDRGFSNLLNGQLPYNVVDPDNFVTTTYGFTASGAAQNEIALAMKGTDVVAHRIDFSNDAAAIGTIGYAGQTTNSNLLNLYGWSFEKEEGFEAIILNLGNSFFAINSPSALTSISPVNNTPQSMVQLSAIEPTAGISSIVTLPVNTPLSIEHLYTTGEVDIVNGVVSIPPYSLTRIIYRNPGTITLRLTDDEICAGTTTTALVQGAHHNASITIQISPFHAISGNDSLFTLPSNLAAGNYSLTAGDGSATSAPVTLTVHPAMSVTASITSGSDIPCADQDIALTADINTTSVDINNSYTYLWVPDRHITDSNPFQQNISLNNTTLTTEAYQVFVFDGQCWAGSNLITFDRGPRSVDLGDDFTVCSTDNFNLRALTTSSPWLANNTFYYRLLKDDTEIVAAHNSPDFTVMPLITGTYVFRVEAWKENGTSSENCPVWDEVTVHVVACCRCSSAIALHPTPHGSTDGPVNNFSDEGELIDAAIALAGSTNEFTVDPPDGDGETVTITGNDPDYSICINGEFWIRNADRGNKLLETLVLQKCTLRLGEDGRIKIRGRAKLVLEGCYIESCNGIAMWNGIYADITDQAVKEPELEITAFATTTRATIRDAKNALVLRRDAPFMIENCDFEDNYVDVLMEKYNKGMNPSTISTCTFTCDGSLNDPVYNDLKKAAFELNDV